MGTGLPPLSLMGSLRWDVVQRLLPDDARAAVLEIGCGQGAVAARLATRYDYVGVELDPVSARTARERLAGTGRGEVRTGDLSVVEPGRAFDLVLAFEVLEHIEDDVQAAADWLQRLRPGGRLIMSVPGYQSRYGAMDAMVGHYRRYEPDDLERLLRKAGLDDVTIRHYGAPLAYAIEPARNAVAGYRAGGPAAALAGLGRGAAHPDPDALTMAARTGHSGRTLQPRGRVVGFAVQAATAPAKVLQRRYPQHGPALVADGRRRPA